MQRTAPLRHCPGSSKTARRAAPRPCIRNPKLLASSEGSDISGATLAVTGGTPFS
ncbi:hypothetical protein PSAC2689_110163 [Paraburkholderia sacchari]|uniref:hypothetical protein n=1 Tax=Paraburkholderia sacchari TaxID=159450 RepID=UPI0039A59AB8